MILRTGFRREATSTDCNIGNIVYYYFLYTVHPFNCLVLFPKSVRHSAFYFLFMTVFVHLVPFFIDDLCWAGDDAGSVPGANPARRR